MMRKNYYLGTDIGTSSCKTEYIVLHELVHFLYPKHNKEFYNFLSIYMPDWKERKKILDYEVVQGI
ncbi:MAG: DUF45 domain-containing protein [Candidatus Lokiarchaeota archaeon]|nr:DUF45 domain-containing protein [Candidatus Lokiarchaeota archaeon]